MTDAALLGRLRDEFGGAAVEPAADGVPRVLPGTTQAMADLLGLAGRDGLRVRIEGNRTWQPADAPADLAVGTRRLARVVEIHPDDLVATAEAGTGFGLLQQELAARRVRVALDPPGRPGRTLGSVIATGTAGPLRHGSGPVRDHLLGLTVVTGDGRVIRSGGKVVKNVAGYDLTRLQAGAFGGFGVVTESHLRLQALPACRVILYAGGERDVLTRQARTFMEEQLAAAGLELCSRDAAWGLIVELAGTLEAVEEEAARVLRSSEVSWTRLTPDRDAAWREELADRLLQAPVTFRLGVFPDGLDETLDLLEARLGTGTVSAGAGRGGLRWSGAPDPAALREVRHLLARREIPLTLERAPWAFRRAMGHFGEYREGIGGLVGRLRQVYDPGSVLMVPLEAGLPSAP